MSKTFLTTCFFTTAFFFTSTRGDSGHYDHDNDGNNCIQLIGIGDGPNDLYTIDSLSNMEDNVYFTFVGFISSQIEPNFFDHETPIQGRLPFIQTGTFMTAMSTYEPIGLDLFGRVDITNSRRKCETTNPNGIQFNTQLFQLHRRLAFWYITFYMVKKNYPWATQQYADKLSAFGVIPGICDDENTFESNGCNNVGTPWGLAYIVIDESFAWFDNDGFNVFGSYNREYNKIPFSDFRGPETRYIPSNNPWKLSNTDLWQPLLEDDGLGFLFHQEHVTPHIGYTAKSLIFTDEEICERSENFKNEFELNYDYNVEIPLLLDRLKSLSEQDKMEIEFFDVKTNLGVLFVQYARALKGPEWVDSYEVLVDYMPYLISTYESIISVWKEKVDFNRVRPTSIIHYLLGDQEIETYAGTTPLGLSYGVQSFPANNFEPYIRTMPHAEFPSGSSCICSAWAEAMVEYWGVDDVTDILPNGLSFTFPAKSSINEPLSTPSEDLTVYWKSWREAGKRCGETRLLGGMHFTDSVPAGELLCKDIGQKAAKIVAGIRDGIAPEFIADINNYDIIERKCYPNDMNGGGNGNNMNLPTKQPTEEPEYNDGDGSVFGFGG